METTHTPTPYRFDGHGINDANGQRIAKMSECGTIPQYIQGVVRITRNPEFDRVGYLLAAAPELLEALKALEPLITLIDARLDVASRETDGDTYILGGVHIQLKERLETLRAAIAKAEEE